MHVIGTGSRTINIYRFLNVNTEITSTDLAYVHMLCVWSAIIALDYIRHDERLCDEWDVILTGLHVHIQQ